MSNTNTGGPAFPRAPFEYIDNGSGLDWAVTHQSGMTLRDYFAAKVLQTYLADQTFKNVTQGEIARLAYDMADSMLEVRDA